MAQGATDKQPRDQEACCADLNEDIREKRRKRRSKPQPWVLLKFAIFLTFGIIGFTTYVYIDRFCVPMLTREPEAMGDRVFGSELHFKKVLGTDEMALTLFHHIAVVFLAVFGVLLIMMLWAYTKVCIAALHISRESSHVQLQVCLTSPGFAKDVCSVPLLTRAPSHVNVEAFSMHNLNPALGSLYHPPPTTSAGHRTTTVLPPVLQPNPTLRHRPLYTMIPLHLRVATQLLNQRIPLLRPA